MENQNILKLMDCQVLVEIPTIFPGETNYKSVYRQFIALENDNTLKLLKRCVLQVMAPINALRMDLCDKCQHFRNVYSTMLVRKKRKLLKKFNEHLVKAER